MDFYSDFKDGGDTGPAPLLDEVGPIALSVFLVSLCALLGYCLASFK